MSRTPRSVVVGRRIASAGLVLAFLITSALVAVAVGGWWR